MKFKLYVAFTKRDPSTVPPFITAISAIAAKGNKVIVFGYYFQKAIYSAWENDNIELHSFSKTPYPNAVWNRLFKSIQFKLWSLKQFLRHKPDIIWWGTQDHPELRELARLRKIKQIMQMHELENNRLVWCRRVSQVVVPELNRAHITGHLAKLKTTPLVLPNIPWPQQHPKDLNQGDPLIKELKDQGQTIVIYPGLIDSYKRCLPELVNSFKILSDHIHLVFMPSSTSNNKEISAIKKLVISQNLDKRVHWCKTRNAPEHLAVLSQCDVGVGLYRPFSLNQVYCAPNRIYEFTSLGIPVVVPDLPSLRQITSGDGVLLCQETSPSSIANSIQRAVHANQKEQARNWFATNGDYLEFLNPILK